MDITGIGSMHGGYPAQGIVIIGGGLLRIGARGQKALGCIGTGGFTASREHMWQPALGIKAVLDLGQSRNHGAYGQQGG